MGFNVETMWLVLVGLSLINIGLKSIALRLDGRPQVGNLLFVLGVICAIIVFGYEFNQ